MGWKCISVTGKIYVESTRYFLLHRARIQHQYHASKPDNLILWIHHSDQHAYEEVHQSIYVNSLHVSFKFQSTSTSGTVCFLVIITVKPEMFSVTLINHAYTRKRTTV